MLNCHALMVDFAYYQAINDEFRDIIGHVYYLKGLLIAVVFLVTIFDSFKKLMRRE